MLIQLSSTTIMNTRMCNITMALEAQLTENVEKLMSLFLILCFPTQRKNQV